jgi:hypothetical protein
MTQGHSFSPARAVAAIAFRKIGAVAALAAIVTIGIGVLQPPKADAYTLEGPKWPNGSTVNMQLSLGNAGRTLSDGNTSWNSAVAPALDAWNGVIGGMQFGKVMNSTVSLARGDHYNSMAFSSTVFGQSFGSNTLAVTYYSYSGSTFLEADILFNTAISWDSYRGSLRSSQDIQRVALHESGHALGLDHSSVGTPIMNAYVTNTYTLQSDDIAGAQSLYGAPSSTPTPTPTPTATPFPTPTPTPSATPFPTPTPTPTPAGFSVSVSAAPTALRSAETAVFTVTASMPAPDLVTIHYGMSGNAVLNYNYSLSGIPGQITLLPGATSGTVTLTVLKGTKRSKTAIMNLETGGYMISTPSSAQVTIKK